MRLRSRTSATPITANWYQLDFRPRLAGDQMADRLNGHEQAAREQDRRLAERAEVLGAAMTVGMLGIRGPAAQANREERQGGGDHVAAGLDPGRDQPEAAGEQPDPELEGHEQRGGRDRDEGCPPLGEHTLVLADRHDR